MEARARFEAQALARFAEDVLSAAGMDRALAEVVAATLLEGDLLGHDTHGLALLAPYLGEIERGSMTTEGEVEVISDRGASLLWDGHRLPGPWLVSIGIDALIARAQNYGSATLVIRRSHHIACLAAYLSRATERGLVIVIASSDPQSASVAPFGGTQALFTPDPIAIGIPSSTTPFLIDISASSVTNGMSARLKREGRRFAVECLFDAKGQPSADPQVLFDDPPGTIQPLGGVDFGHKGFGLALMIEALTGGLSGVGRADPKEGWGASVFISIHDPSAFGGSMGFSRQIDWIADSARGNPPRAETEGVRLPGDRALKRKREQLLSGVALYPEIIVALKTCASKYHVGLPAPLLG